MTGADLRALRYGYALDRAVSLAKRLGIHRSTITRNEKRATVTPYVVAAVQANQTAAAFARGQMEGESWKKSQ